MDTKKIEAAVYSYLRDSVGIESDQLRPDQEIEPLNLDSLDIIELGMHLEESVGVTVEDDWNIGKSATLGELVDLVSRKSGATQ